MKIKITNYFVFVGRNAYTPDYLGVEDIEEAREYMLSSQKDLDEFLEVFISYFFIFLFCSGWRRGEEREERAGRERERVKEWGGRMVGGGRGKRGGLLVVMKS